MRRNIDRRHFTIGKPKPKPGQNTPHIAGFNLVLTATQRALPRNIRRALAGVRRPLRLAERRALAADRTAKEGAR